MRNNPKQEVNREDISNSDSKVNKELSATMFKVVIKIHAQKTKASPKNFPTNISLGFRGFVINNSRVPLDISPEKLPIDSEQMRTIKSHGLISKNKFTSTIS